MDLIITLALVAGAVFLENVWYDCRRERLQTLAEELRRSEAPRWVRRVGGIVGIGLRVLLTLCLSWLFTLPMVEAIGGFLTLASVACLLFTSAPGGREPIESRPLKAKRPWTQIAAFVRVDVGSDLFAILVVGVLCIGNGWAACLGSLVGSLVMLIRFVALPGFRLPWLRFPALALLVSLSAWRVCQDQAISSAQHTLTNGDPPVPIFELTLLLALFFALALFLLVWPVTRGFIIDGLAGFVVGGSFFVVIAFVLAVILTDPLGLAVFVRILFTLGDSSCLVLLAFLFTGACAWPLVHKDEGLLTAILAPLGGAFLLMFILLLPLGLAVRDPYLLVLRNGSFSQHSIVILTNQNALQPVKEITINFGDSIPDNTLQFENETQQVQTLCLGIHQNCEGSTQGPKALQAPGLRLSPGQIVKVRFPSPGVYHLTCLSPQWQDLAIHVMVPYDDGGD